MIQRASALSRASRSANRVFTRSAVYARKNQVHLKPRTSVKLIGVPFTGGQPKGGVDLAPDALRAAGISKELTNLGWHVTDLGDVPVPKEPQAKDVFDRVKNPLWVGNVCKGLADKTAEVVAQGDFPLVMGGDHSIAVGTIAGVAQAHPNVGVVWVDAHADINTSGTTPSGNLHGMPLSFLTGLTRPVPGFEWLDMDKPVLQKDQLVYIGLRDLQMEEKEFLRDHSIKCFDMHDVDKLGIGRVMSMANKILGARPIHVSFDIDALDPREAPSTGTAVRGGLSFREGAYVCEYMHDTGRLVSMELVEINPALGDKKDQELTVSTGISMIKAALGESLTL